MLRTYLLYLLVCCFSICLFTRLASAEHIIRVATFYPVTHPTHISLEYLKKMLAIHSRGELELQIYPDNKLGEEEVYCNSVKRGIVQMAVAGRLIQKDEPMLALLEPPFVFDTWKQVKVAYNGEIGDEIKGNYTQKTGAIILGYSASSFRQISSNIPIRSMEDLRSIVIRVPPNNLEMKFFHSLKIQSDIMPMSKVYESLESGIIQGLDDPFAIVQTKGWWKAQPYMLETNHTFVANPWIINQKFYKSLPENLRLIFDEDIKEALYYNWTIAQQREKDAKLFLKNNGVTISKPDQAFREQMKASLADFYTWYYDTVPNSRHIITQMKQLPK